MKHFNLFILTLLFNIVNGQVSESQYKRVVEFTEQHFSRYSIPQGVSQESLSTMDLMEAIPYTSIVKVKIIIDHNNNLITEKLYLPGTSGISRYEGVSRSLSSPSGIRLFDINNLEVIKDSESSSYGTSPSLPIDMITNIGLSPSIIAPTSQQIQALCSQGISYYTSDNNKFYFVQGEVNILSDVLNNSQETRIFKAGRLHISESKSMFEISAGKSVVTKNVTKTYKSLPSEILLEIEDIILFSDYKILDNGVLVYEQPSEQQSNQISQRAKSNTISSYDILKPFNRLLEVRHNSLGSITIELPNLREGKSEIILMSIDGKPLRFIKEIESNNLIIDMTEFPSGNYIVHFTDKLGRLSKQIINF